MEALLIGGWVGFLVFLAWEFFTADSLPQKYARLKPRTIRLVDVGLAILVLLSIWQLAGA